MNIACNLRGNSLRNSVGIVLNTHGVGRRVDFIHWHYVVSCPTDLLTHFVTARCDCSCVWRVTAT